MMLQPSTQGLEAVVMRIKQLNDEYDARLETVQTVHGAKRAATEAAIAREREEHRQRTRALEEKLAAADEELARERERVDEERKRALRALHREAEEAKGKLQDWLHSLDEALVSSGVDERSHASRAAVGFLRMRESDEMSSSHAPGGGEVERLAVSAAGERACPPVTTTRVPAATATDASYLISLKRARHHHHDDDRAFERGEEGGDEQPVRVAEARRIPRAASSDPEDLEQLFEAFTTKPGVKPKLLMDLFASNRKVEIVRAGGLHTRELKRATTCRACGVRMEKTCYTGIIGETGKRCDSHKFCGRCGDYIYARFEDKCPGRFWFNCA